MSVSKELVMKTWWRQPPGLKRLNWAPSWGSSRRTTARVPAGQRAGAKPPHLGACRYRPGALFRIHHPCGKEGPQEFEDLAVADAFFHRLHQPVVRYRLKTRGNVRLDHLPSTPPRLIDEDLEGIVRRALGSEPETTGLKVSLKDRLDDRLQCRLHDAVTNRQRSPFGRAGLGYPDQAGRQQPVAIVPKVRFQFIEEPGDPVLLDRQGEQKNRWTICRP